MSNDTQDHERVRAVMESYIDDEYLATKLGIEDALIEMCATVRREVLKEIRGRAARSGE